MKSDLIDPTRIDSLKPREKECLRLVYQRLTTKEIAIELGLAVGTVAGYITEAIDTLDAPNRRRAAEWLHTAEADPSKRQLDFVGVEPGHPTASARSTERWRDCRRLLPIRQYGAPHNDLSFFARAIWPFALAAVIAIGFGMLVVGADVLSNIYRRLGS